MIQNKLQAIILAAGKSTRLKSGHNKMLEKICGQEMILFPIKLLASLKVDTTVVVGQEHDTIKGRVQINHQSVTFAQQKQQNGTGDALRCSMPFWAKEHVLIINGDMPLITQDIITTLYEKHTATNATISFVMAHNTDPETSYGRIVKKENEVKIIEAKEFDGDIAEHCCINAGIYLVRRDFLEQHINEIAQNAVSQEFHVTDLVAIASAHNRTITTTSAPFDFIRGINNQHELWAAEQIQRSNIIKYWMERGVRFSVAHNVHIDLDVSIGAGTYVGCGVHLLYGTTIGKNCKIHEYTSLEGTSVGDNSNVYPFSIITNSTIGDDASVGPFAHIKEQTTIDNKSVIGNFVEVKNSTIGAGTRAKHLSYIGDTQTGTNVNIGAGTVTCNFDGRKKHKTTIAHHAFIGSNNTLIAPVHIGEGAFTAAGSAITQDVPADALAVGRSRQENKDGYAKRLLKKDKHIPATRPPETVCTEQSISDEKKKTTFMGAVRTTNDTLDEQNH